MPELMKGNCWYKRRHKVTYPVYVEDKHDEIRCHVIVDKSNPHDTRIQFLSYAGKPLANMGRFCKLFDTLARGTGYREFDMGFECNGNFNDSYRWVRSTKGVPEDLRDASFKFYIFGLPTLGGDLSQQSRERWAIAQYANDWCTTPVIMPYAQIAYDAEEVDAAFVCARSRGLEGVMVKQPDFLYERKRTDGWLKMKPEEEADAQITGFVEATATVDDPERGVRIGDGLGRVGSILVRCEDGSEAAPHGIPHDLGRDMHLNPGKYLGEWLEFAYMERDRQGGYRHPVFRRLREAKV